MRKERARSETAVCSAPLESKSWLSRKVGIRDVLLCSGALVAGCTYVAFWDVIWGAALPERKATLWEIPVMLLLAIIAWFLAIAVHEIGHFVGGVLNGARPFALSIGTGRPLLRFRCFGVQVVIGWFWSSGYVLAQQLNSSGYRRRKVLEVFAGSLANLLVACVVLASARGADYAAWLGGDGNFFAQLFLGFFVAFNFFGIVNLIPVDSQSSIAPHNDGLLIYQLLTMNRKELKKSMEAEKFVSWQQVADDGTIKLRPERVRSLSWKSDDPTELLVLASYVTEGDPAERDYPLAARIYFRIADEPALETSLLEPKDALDWALSMALLGNVIATTHRDRAEADARKLVAMAPPDDAAAKLAHEDTLGTVLIELGKYGEGMALLERVYRETKRTADQQYSSAYLALACALLGRSDEAKVWLDKAQFLNAPLEITTRVERALGETLGKSTLSRKGSEDESAAHPDAERGRAGP
ncbi:MAG: M50 family metallopeptidase [Verrucomicrobiota bacterium]